MDKLIELPIRDYSSDLSSSSPAPGGGAAAALCGAQGIALTLMVTNLTLNKKKYEEYEALCRKTKEEGEMLMERLLLGMDEDKDAFHALSQAYQLPKATEQEKLKRSHQIAEATLVATEVPLTAMEQGLEGLRLTKELVGKSNRTAVSDLGVAALNLLACVKGAWLNVLINLPGIKEEEQADRLRERGEELYRKSELLAEKIYDEVVKML